MILSLLSRQAWAGFVNGETEAVVTLIVRGARKAAVPPLHLTSFYVQHLGGDAGDSSRMHGALRLRLKALAACWDFQFTQWFSPTNPYAVFPSVLGAKIENVSQTERLK